MRTSRRVRTVAAVVLASGYLLAATPMAGASPAGDFTYAVRPAQAGDTSHAEPHFNYALPGGSQVADSIEISNLGAPSLTLIVYPADMVNLPGGGIAPAEPDTPQRGVGAWIDISEIRVDLGPNQTQTVPFRLQVPTGTLPGDYAGAVVVAEDRTPTETGPVAVTTRVALQVNVHVPGVLSPAAQLGDVSARRQGKEQLITATLRNTGNLTLTVVGHVHLRHGNTSRELNLTPTGTILLPGDSVTLGGRWDRLPTWGRYHAQVVVDARTPEGPTIALIGRPTTLTFFPWDTVLTGIIIVAALFVLARRVRQRRRHQRQIATSRPSVSAGRPSGRGRQSTSSPAHRRTNRGQPPAHRHRRHAA